MNPNCPECGKMLQPVTYPGGYLNHEQWESLRAGDWFCALHDGVNLYYWNSDFQQVSTATSRPPFYPFKAPFKYEWAKVFDANGNHVLDIRGWGNLIGKGGGLGLSEEEAEKIQDAYGQRIVDLMNKDAKGL